MGGAFWVNVSETLVIITNRVGADKTNQLEIPKFEHVIVTDGNGNASGGGRI